MNKSILFLLMLISLAISAQEIKVSGVIRDSIGDPLELANVIATVKSSGDIESYGITNYEGRYQLNLSIENTYILKASFLGYETIEKEIILSENEEDQSMDFILNSKSTELDGVEIVYEMPVTIKGDTIVYNADSFTTGEERKLGDVMKKLPGVEVNDDGEIEVEGKTVDKVMVEGKDFFDGDSKLATKNIPADAVDKVEVLRNYNEVDQMRGLGNDQDNVAINVKLKEGKKNFWFGEVTAGIGLAEEEERYLVHPKLFYYSPKYSLNFITDFNDVGEVPFTFRDYFKFTGGFRNFNRGGGTHFDIGQNDLGFALMQNNLANEIESNFFAGNFSWNVTKKWDLSGFTILSDNRTNLVNNTIRNFISTNTTETTNSVTDQRTQLGMFKLSSMYKPNSNFQMDYDALIKASRQTENNETLSLFDEKVNNISENKENKPKSINQNVNMYFTANDNNIFAGQVQHLWQDEDPFYRAAVDLLPFAGILPVDTLQNRYKINQEKNIRTSKLDAKIDYYYVINNKSNINFTLGSTLSSQKFDSRIFQLLDNSDELELNETPEIEGEVFPLANDVEYRFSDAFLGAHYKFKTGIFTFTPGLTLHNYSLKNEQVGISVSQNDWMVLPDLNVLIQLKKSENLRFNYSVGSEYTDVNNYAEAFVFNNYNSMFKGNRNLENALSHSYSLNYFSFNMFNYTNVSGSLNYTKRLDAVKYNSNIVSINQVSSVENIDSNFPDETFSAFGRFSKRIKQWQFRLNANLSYSKSNNMINSQIAESNSFTQNYTGSVITNFREWPNFELGYGKTINQYKNGGLDQTYFTDRPYVNVDVRFLKHFSLIAEWNYYNYTNDSGTIDNNYSFFNADLYFRKGESPWEFKIQATNILDTKFINTDNFSDEFNSTTQYFVLPRILMFVVKYDL
jgi:hypothetical protein